MIDYLFGYLPVSFSLILKSTVFCFWLGLTGVCFCYALTKKMSVRTIFIWSFIVSSTVGLAEFGSQIDSHHFFLKNNQYKISGLDFKNQFVLSEKSTCQKVSTKQNEASLINNLVVVKNEQISSSYECYKPTNLEISCGWMSINSCREMIEENIDGILAQQALLPKEYSTQSAVVFLEGDE